jgi:hypothetical protein
MREEKSNLNLTPHTTVFHQFPIEAMVGPGIRTGIEKIFSLSGSNSFNVFLYSIFQPSVYQAASVEFMPAMRCPPLPYPAVPTPNLVVSRTRPLNPVPRPPKKTVTPLSLRIFSTMLFLMLFLKLVLYTQSLELYVNIFFISHPK